MEANVGIGCDSHLAGYTPISSSLQQDAMLPVIESCDGCGASCQTKGTNGLWLASTYLGPTRDWQRPKPADLWASQATKLMLLCVVGRFHRPHQGSLRFWPRTMPPWSDSPTSVSYRGCALPHPSDPGLETEKAGRRRLAAGKIPGDESSKKGRGIPHPPRVLDAIPRPSSTA